MAATEFPADKISTATPEILEVNDDKIATLHTEFLENVLLRVDENALLLSQRVNKKFHETIIGSKLLQEKLFFRQSPKLEPKSHWSDENNPLLPWAIIGHVFNSWKPNHGKYHIQSPREELGFTLEAWPAPSDPNIKRVRLIKIDVLDNRRWSGDESWRRMFLFGNPHVKLRISATMELEYVHGVDAGTAARMGEVLDVALDGMAARVHGDFRARI